MKKIFLLIPLFLLLLHSCEKDDICDSGAATTARLIIQFYDINNRSVVKNVTDLKVQGEGADNPVVFNLSGVDDEKYITNDTIIALPLRVASLQTKYTFTLNADAPINQQFSDIIVFNYGTDDVYVSRACGFKTVFDFLNRPVGTNAFTLNGGSVAPFTSAWIRDMEIVQTNINNEKETHVKIYF